MSQYLCPPEYLRLPTACQEGATGWTSWSGRSRWKRPPVLSALSILWDFSCYFCYDCTLLSLQIIISWSHDYFAFNIIILIILIKQDSHREHNRKDKEEDLFLHLCKGISFLSLEWRYVIRRYIDIKWYIWSGGWWYIYIVIYLEWR